MRIITISGLLIVVQSLSATLFEHIRIGNIAPNFLIVIVVSFALLRGSKEGTLIGILAGLLQDVSFSLSIGGTVIVYGLIGYICGKLNKNFYRENFVIPLICTLLSSLFYSLINLMIMLLKGESNIIYLAKMIVIPEVIYTVTLSLIIYQISYLINGVIENNEKRSRNIF